MPKNPNTRSSRNTYHVTRNTTKAHLSDDLLLLIACCQTEPSNDDMNFINSYLDTESQIDSPQSTQNSKPKTQNLISLASSHGILPLVYKTIKNLHSSLLTPHSSLEQLLNELKVHYQSIAQRNMSMSAELIKIMKLFQKNDIRALSFKGPSLAQIAYGDITLRQFGDLDILIQKKDINKVEELCISMGYKPYYDLTEVQKEVWYTYAKDMVFYHPHKQSIIELHWLLLDVDFPLQIDLDSIWEQTNTEELNKVSVETFSSEHLLLYLCIHGSKHLWERIIWIKDIDLMIRTQNIDLERVVKQAQKADLERMLLLGLYLSHTLFGTLLPKSIHETLEDAKELPELSDFVFKNWQTPQSMFQNTIALIRFFPKFTLKAKYLHKVILKPSNREYQLIDLPKGLYWVYYLLRPYLLLRKYLTKNQ